MNVSDKIDPQTKAMMQNVILEIQVLQNLLKEREGIREGLIRDLLPKFTVSPELYVLKVNFKTDEWLLELKAGILTVPNIAMNREQRRAVKNN